MHTGNLPMVPNCSLFNPISKSSDVVGDSEGETYFWK